MPNTYTYNRCLREREQVETNLGGIPTVVGRNAVDLKMINAEARRTTDRSINLVSIQIDSLHRRTQQQSKFEQLIGSYFNADLNRINPLLSKATYSMNGTRSSCTSGGLNLFRPLQRRVERPLPCRWQL